MLGKVVSDSRLSTGTSEERQGLTVRQGVRSPREIVQLEVLENRLTFQDVDVATPRQIVVINRPKLPSVIWRDLLTRVILEETFDQREQKLQLRLRGVPNSKSEILVWTGNPARTVEVNYPESGLGEVTVSF